MIIPTVYAFLHCQYLINEKSIYPELNSFIFSIHIWEQLLMHICKIKWIRKIIVIVGEKKKKTPNCYVWDPGESLINFHFHRLVPSLAWFSKCVNKSGHALDFLAALEKNEPAQVSFSPGQSPDAQELWFHVQGVPTAQRETLVTEQVPEWELW